MTADPTVDGSPQQQPARRLLLVHAHPDDESLATGLTMARYAAEGAGVTLVTCTRGEEGEVIGPELAHLVSTRDDGLGEHRVGELGRAMAALGVRDHRLLAGGRWRDSGMAWLAPGRAGSVAGADAAHPMAFVRAPLDEPASALADVLREVRPQVVVTYDPQGGYGHPDHVRAHEVTVRAVELAMDAGGGRPGWTVPRVYSVQVALSWAMAERAAVLWAQQAGELPDPLRAPAPDDPFPSAVVPDGELACVVEAPEHAAARVAALRAHATQVRVAQPWFALSNDVAHLLGDREGFRLAVLDGAPVAPSGRRPQPPLTDLFAGLDG